MGTMTLAPESAIIAGILLLSLITVESGGWLMTRVLRGSVPANGLQTSLYRAGHAHAGVLLVLGLAILALSGAMALPPFLLWFARVGVPIAAILMPAGFFLGALGRDPQKPNRLMGVVWIGATVLALALLTAGIGLIAGAVNGFAAR
jgi:hypothetical protein